MSWNYTRKESDFKPIPEGIHRIRVKSAEKAVSKSGNDMLVLQFDVSGYNSILYHYIVFMADKPEITNRNLTQFYDSFKDIPEGEFDTAKWIGKGGACQVKHEEYNGKTQARLHYFISANKQADLPPWQEPAKAEENGKTQARLHYFISANKQADLPPWQKLAKAEEKPAYTVEPVNAKDDLPF